MRDRPLGGAPDRDRDRSTPNRWDLQVGLALADALARAGQIHGAVEQYSWIADALAARGQTQMALATYRLLGGLAAYDVAAQLRCADFYARTDRLGDAIAIWDWAADVLVGTGRPLEGADALARAVEADGDDITRRRRLGELYARLGMIDAAVDQLHAVARRLFEAAQTEDFVAVAERIIALRRDHVPTLRDLARVHLHRRDFARFVACMRKLLAASRGDVVAGELIVEGLVAGDRLAAATHAAVVVGRELLARDGIQARETARRVLHRARRRAPDDRRLDDLWDELDAEPVDDIAIEIDATTIDDPKATIAQRIHVDEGDGPTNVFYLTDAQRRARAMDMTRPDLGAKLTA